MTIDDNDLKDRIADLESDLGIDLSYIMDIMDDFDRVLTERIHEKYPDMRTIDGLAAIALLLSSRYKYVVDDVVSSGKLKDRLSEYFGEDDVSKIQEKLSALTMSFSRELTMFEADMGTPGYVAVPLSASVYLAIALMRRAKSNPDVS